MKKILIIIATLFLPTILISRVIIERVATIEGTDNKGWDADASWEESFAEEAGANKDSRAPISQVSDIQSFERDAEREAEEAYKKTVAGLETAAGFVGEGLGVAGKTTWKGTKVFFGEIVPGVTITGATETASFFTRNQLLEGSIANLSQTENMVRTIANKTVKIIPYLHTAAWGNNRNRKLFRLLFSKKYLSRLLERTKKRLPSGYRKMYDNREFQKVLVMSKYGIINKTTDLLIQLNNSTIRLNELMTRTDEILSKINRIEQLLEANS